MTVNLADLDVGDTIELTAERLKELLEYDPTLGRFTWKVSNNGYVKVGSIAGCLDPKGYVQIRIDRKLYKGHRLAWLYMFGEFPKEHLDHIDGDRANNRIENLRAATIRENSQNRKEHRGGHLVGTSFNKRVKKWESYIQINGKRKRLGYFETQQEAHSAYLKECEGLVS